MNRPTMFVVTVLAATFFCSPGSKALAQQPSPSSVTLLCKTSLGGSGFVFVTLSNLWGTENGGGLFAALPPMPCPTHSNSSKRRAAERTSRCRCVATNKSRTKPL